MKRHRAKKFKTRVKFAQATIDAGPHNQAEIFYEYDRAVDRLARLYSYANTLPSNADMELSERAERLAKDDLLTFAIHCRRLCEFTKVVPLAKSEKVPTCVFDMGPGGLIRANRKPGQSVWSIVNTAVHHTRLDIYTSDMEVELSVFGANVAEALAHSRRKFLPIVLVRSKGAGTICFELRKFVDCVCSGLVEPLIEALTTKSVFVELDYREI